MIYLSDIRDFLKTVFKAEHYYIGKLDNKQDESLGVYSLKQSGAPVRAIGDESTYTQSACLYSCIGTTTQMKQSDRHAVYLKRFTV